MRPQTLRGGTRRQPVIVRDEIVEASLVTAIVGGAKIFIAVRDRSNAEENIACYFQIGRNFLGHIQKDRPVRQAADERIVFSDEFRSRVAVRPPRNVLNYRRTQCGGGLIKNVFRQFRSRSGRQKKFLPGRSSGSGRKPVSLYLIARCAGRDQTSSLRIVHERLLQLETACRANRDLRSIVAMAVERKFRVL